MERVEALGVTCVFLPERSTSEQLEWRGIGQNGMRVTISARKPDSWGAAICLFVRLGDSNSSVCVWARTLEEAQVKILTEAQQAAKEQVELGSAIFDASLAGPLNRLKALARTSRSGGRRPRRKAS